MTKAFCVLNEKGGKVCSRVSEELVAIALVAPGNDVGQVLAGGNRGLLARLFSVICTHRQELIIVVVEMFPFSFVYVYSLEPLGVQQADRTQLALGIVDVLAPNCVPAEVSSQHLSFLCCPQNSTAAAALVEDIPLLFF
jgi:hypothetical protein